MCLTPVDFQIGKVQKSGGDQRGKKFFVPLVLLFVHPSDVQRSVKCAVTLSFHRFDNRFRQVDEDGDHMMCTPMTFIDSILRHLSRKLKNRFFYVFFEVMFIVTGTGWVVHGGGTEQRPHWCTHVYWVLSQQHYIAKGVLLHDAVDMQRKHDQQVNGLHANILVFSAVAFSLSPTHSHFHTLCVHIYMYIKYRRQKKHPKYFILSKFSMPFSLEISCQFFFITFW